MQIKIPDLTKLDRKTLVYIVIGVSVLALVLLITAIALWWQGQSPAPVAVVGAAAVAAAAEATRQRLAATKVITNAVADATLLEEQSKATRAQVDAVQDQIRKDVSAATDEQLAREATDLFKPGGR